MPDKELLTGSFTSSQLSQLGLFLWWLWGWASTLERGQKLLRWALPKWMHHHTSSKGITPRLVKLCVVSPARKFSLGSLGWTSHAPLLDLAQGACSNSRRGQWVAVTCSYAGQVSPRVVGWAYLPAACSHQQRGHSHSSAFSWGSKHIWKRSGIFQQCLIPTTSPPPPHQALLVYLSMAGQVMPGHTIDAPTDKTYWRDTEASLKQKSAQTEVQCSFTQSTIPAAEHAHCTRLCHIVSDKVDLFIN